MAQPVEKIQSDFLTLTKPHFSTKVYHCYLAYLKNTYPGMDLEDLCRSAGLSLEYLENEGNWVSVYFDRRFMQLAIERSGDAELSFRAGVQTISPEVLGRVTYFLAQSALSARFLYQSLPKLTSIFSKVTRAEIVEDNKEFLILRLSELNQNLNNEERALLRDSMPHILQNTVGHYAAVTTAFDMPLASVETCVENKAQGAPISYLLKIDYQNESRMFRMPFILLSFLLPVIILAYDVSWPALSSLSVSFAAIVFLAMWLGFTIVSLIQLKGKFRQTMSAMNHLDQRYQDLFLAKETVQKTLESYARFVPQEFLQILGRENILDVKLGDYVEGEMTVLFVDMIGFTKLAESLSAEETFLLINRYLDCISPIIRRHSGFIDKFMGDGLMAVFRRSSVDAVSAAIEMNRAVNVLSFNDLAVPNAQAIGVGIGIGINKGQVTMGTVGYAEQMRATVISDAVNVAYRLEAATRRLGVTIIVSESVITEIAPTRRFKYRSIGEIQLRGRIHSVMAYEIMDKETPRLISAKS